VLEFDERLTDQARDALAIAAIRAAIAHGKPVLGICRGLQEINVAFGGTLRQSLCTAQGALVHHEDISLPRDEQYRPAHTVTLTPDGKLHEILAELRTSEIRVNSLHRQGIERLGAGLRAEAVAPDGLIEAVSVAASRAPMLAVQWHLEWSHHTDAVSRALWQAFALFCDQCRGMA
jgi:putative glutamine amidotransferase